MDERLRGLNRHRPTGVVQHDAGVIGEERMQLRQYLDCRIGSMIRIVKDEADILRDTPVHGEHVLVDNRRLEPKFLEGALHDLLISLGSAGIVPLEPVDANRWLSSDLL